MENTTDPTETVQVPVELLKRIRDARDNLAQNMALTQLRAFIPTPKPRLVVMDLRHIEQTLITNGLGRTHSYIKFELVDALPDLFTTLDDVIDLWAETKHYVWDGDRAELKARICAAFGVLQ